MDSNKTFKATGPPAISERGLDVLCFHLDRYLDPWFEQYRVSPIYVTVGFHDSAFAPVTIQVSGYGSQPISADWTYDQLHETFDQGETHFELAPGPAKAQSGPTERKQAIPIIAETIDKRSATPLAFVVFRNSARLSREAKARLRSDVKQALLTAQRNSMRLFFDENRTRPIKELLYSLMDHLPAWTGCDHSAAFVMTSSLETMTLTGSTRPEFDVLAERLFFPEQWDFRDMDTSEPVRLAGMSMDLGDEQNHFISAAAEKLRRHPDCPYQIYSRGADWQNWQARLAFDDGNYTPYYDISSRPKEKMVVLVPLVTEESNEFSLLGFLSLRYRQNVNLPQPVADFLGELGNELASVLQYSPLYSIGSKKLWLLQQVDSILEDLLPSDAPTKARADELIGEVTQLMAENSDIPSFAIGYVRSPDSNSTDSERRYLRYVHPYGWTHFDQLNLPIDIEPSERTDSSVSSLAVRLGRHLVLSGGHGEGEQLEFKNYLWVNEQTGDLADARREHRNSNFEGNSDWIPLRNYYKPARTTAYATLAHPIMLADRKLGVITVEVEKPTNWTWWTGFGGQLFWSMLAKRLAHAFDKLGV